MSRKGRGRGWLAGTEGEADSPLSREPDLGIDLLFFNFSRKYHGREGSSGLAGAECLPQEREIFDKSALVLGLWGLLPKLRYQEVLLAISLTLE